MNTYRFLSLARGPHGKEPPETERSSPPGRRSGAFVVARLAIGAKWVLIPLALTIGIAALSSSSWAETADEMAKQYKIEIMQQALQTKEHFDLYGLRFDSDISTIPAGAKSLLDDIATTLKNFPEWNLRIVGHTDATGDPQPNETLSLARAEAIKTALVERGVEEQRLAAAGAGETRPVTGNDTAEGRALNRRVELVRFTDSTEAKRLLKSMSDYQAAQAAISFDYDAALEVVTSDSQKLALSSSGSVALHRPDKIRATRAGGFVDAETVFDGKTLTLLGKNANKYTQVEMPGTIEHVIDELKDKYDRPLPAADLLMSNSYEELMHDVYDSKDLGSGVINGTECDFLAFRKDDVDLQIWIAQGDKPHPCKYAITSRKMADGPQYSVEIRNWKTGDGVAKDDYSFINSTKAEQIDLKDLQKSVSELPENFTMGESK